MQTKLDETAAKLVLEGGMKLTVNSDHVLMPEEIVQISAAASLKRIADVLEAREKRVVEYHARNPEKPTRLGMVMVQDKIGNSFQAEYLCDNLDGVPVYILSQPLLFK
jgi:hypothetical protein